MIVEERRRTVRDYNLLPERAPYQLIDGDLVMSPSPNQEHQGIISNIGAELWTLVKLHRRGRVFLAPMDVYLSETEVFQPDIIFISRDRLDIVKEKVHGAPDLVMEVLSPSTAYYDLVHKKAVYEAAGVREYWIVDPKEKTIEIFVNGEKGFQSIARMTTSGIVRSTILSDFVVRLDDVFRLE